MGFGIVARPPGFLCFCGLEAHALNVSKVARCYKKLLYSIKTLNFCSLAIVVIVLLSRNIISEL